MLHWDRASLSSAGPDFPPLANCWSHLGRDSEDMVPVGCRVRQTMMEAGAVESLQLSQWDTGDGTTWGMGKRMDRATTDGRLGGSMKGRQELLAGRCNLHVPPGKWMLLVCA